MKVQRLSGVALFVAVVCLTAPLSAAPGDENWDSRFGLPGASQPPTESSGYSGGIAAIAVVTNNIFFGGSFTQIGGVNISNIAMWDGTNWSAVGAVGGGVDGGVGVILASGADLYVGGIFSQAGGAPATGIAKWDGTNWSALGNGILGDVRALLKQGNMLYVGGRFAEAGGMKATNIAAWDGNQWLSFDGGVGKPCGDEEPHTECGAVNALAFRDGILYVGGSFRTAGSLNVNNVAAWDGTHWMTLSDGLRTYDIPNLPDRGNGDVFAFFVRSNQLCAAGQFNKAGDISATNFAKWDGTGWSSIGTGSDAPPPLALVQNGTDIYVAGIFSSAGETAATNVARWDGTNWSNLGSGLSGRFVPSVSALGTTGTELFVGGVFESAGGLCSTNIALWHIPHSLTISRGSRGHDSLTVSWPATGTNFPLEAVATIGDTNWTAVSKPFSVLDGQCIVTNEISSERRFYRLRRR